MFVCCECCVFSGRGLCDRLITRPEESYQLWCVVVCDLETSSRMRRPWPALGCSAIKKVWILYGCNLKSSFKFLNILYVCYSEFVCFLQMKWCVFQARLTVILYRIVKYIGKI